jgi:hypothetical protein
MTSPTGATGPVDTGVLGIGTVVGVGIGAGHSFYPTDAMWEAGTGLTPTSDFGAISATAGSTTMNCATMLCIY